MIHWYKGKTNDGEELQIEDLEIFQGFVLIHGSCCWVAMVLMTACG